MIVVLFLVGCRPVASGSKDSSTGAGGAGSGGNAAGGAVGRGGTTSTGGATTSTGGTAAGGATGQASGGAIATGGALSTGGTVTDAATDRHTDSPLATGGVGTGGISGSGGTPDAAVRDGQNERAAEVGRDVASDLPVTSDVVPSDSMVCPAHGHVTYTLARADNPTDTQRQAYDLITTSMDKATYYYNCYTSITKALSVSYDPSVSTADGNANGSIRFGGLSYMEYTRAMHEISHTVGVGTASNWRSFIDIPQGGGNGPWTGQNANAELRSITGVATDTLTADSQHFWPYGLNYVSEVKSDADLVGHCRIVVALRKDLGLQ